MKVLWLCNMMLPMIAQHFQMEASNKEGWLSGLAEVMLTRQAENGIQLAIAFPVGETILPAGEEVFEKELLLKDVPVRCFGFREDTVNPHIYDKGLEERMQRILSGLQPDVVHCFGTEYPHALAMCRVFPDKSRLLITIQGLCSVYANVYEADLPEQVVRHVTFRDFLKKDDIQRQKAKYEARGRAEIEAIRLAGNIGGRTDWDRHYAKEWHPEARYFEMRETLRSNFYEDRWVATECEPHSIFLSQGDYPIKGLHYMLLAMPEILKRHPDTRIYVAGNSVTAYKTWKDRLKISAYGAYLRSLMKEYQLEDKVFFLGRLDSEQMKARYLKSHLFVCCSAIENSPNSLGEAMLLGVPCVSADVGGIPSIFTAGVDGVGYAGTKSRKNSFDREVYEGKDALYRIADNLSRAVLEMWQDSEREAVYCENARQHALISHDRRSNYEKTVETYAEIAGVEQNT